ncbi:MULTISPECIES: ATP-binding protein [Actinomadura]|uniref:ATP-binding protein n=1 Tax=Actinomadura yumaensis TaxID=111807 RepID=A0ABW2CC96_9ACTN|nr:ATP-binding protein [Actinomadura sp. J1-007]MWK33716.1 ATP-binding protein [Actinomadura sp. J1-007]
MPEPATIVIKAHPQAIKQVRDFAALVFGDWGLEDHIARTVVTELATNAIKHGSAEGDPVVVRVYRREDGCPVLEAWDRSDALPVARPFDLTRESGRGLLLMGALVRRWGTRPLAERGKVVFAELEPTRAPD